ncbi:MAG: ATP cone domain-containing protein, partial [Chthoniobacterales bacterium]
QAGDATADFDPAEIAETVGNALTNLILSRNQKETDIFTDENRRFVSTVARAVGKRLANLATGTTPLTLSESEIYLLVEQILIEKNAADVAKSLLLMRKSMRATGKPVVPQVSIIRRNNKLVPWDSTKVEVAVRKAFLTLGLDSEPAVKVADAVAENIHSQRVSRIHIEDVQDLVQEELMQQGHYKVAEAYILYRAHRRHLRETEAAQPGQDQRQESMIMITQPDGQNVFWDGVDLKKRIEFAMLGLDLCLNKDEIESELRRSVFSEMKREDLKQTIILNAKSLIERDADFSRFAGRILLSYIYEEVLDWNIATDGIGKLREAHQKAFRRYLQRGVEIKRLNPELLEKFDLDKVSVRTRSSRSSMRPRWPRLKAGASARCGPRNARPCIHSGGAIPARLSTVGARSTKLTSRSWAEPGSPDVEAANPAFAAPGGGGAANPRSALLPGSGRSSSATTRARAGRG